MTRHVPHNPPLDDGEGPCNYVAGWNMPGYLPVMEPAFFETFDDAKRFILNELADVADWMAIDGDDDQASEIDALREELNLESGPFCVAVDDHVYWVEQVESPASAN